MVTYENQCVDCGLPCLMKGCPYWEVPMVYCDECKDEAEYRIGGTDYCEKCAKKFLQEEFDNLTIEEKAGVLGFGFEDMDTVILNEQQY